MNHVYLRLISFPPHLPLSPPLLVSFSSLSRSYYGPKDTTSGNVGDSWCAMGRIAWFDSHARKYVGTSAALTAFNDYTLAPLVRDLIANTWMHERWVHVGWCVVCGVRLYV